MLDRQGIVELFSLEDRVAVVTGATSGIGAATATLLAQAGAHVVIVGRSQERGQATAASLADQGLAATAIAADVADEAQVVELFGEVADRLGAVDVLVNNAGTTDKHPILETTAADWQAIQDTNLMGAFLCLREAAKLMTSRGRGGRIVNVSSSSSDHQVRTATPPTRHPRQGSTCSRSRQPWTSPRRASSSTE